MIQTPGKVLFRLSAQAHTDRERQTEGRGIEVPPDRLIPILVNFPLEDHYTRKIETLDPHIRVLPVYEPLYRGAPSEKESEWRAHEGAQLQAMLLEAEILFTSRFPLDWLDRTPSLKWVQLTSAGSDYYQRSGLFDKRPDLLLTTASGVHEIPISEHIVAVILYFSRRLSIAARNQPLRKWERYKGEEMAGKTACLVGYGPIARRTARLLAALGMTVVCVRASIAEQQPGFESVERFYPPEELNEVLSQSDFVVLAAPRTPRTEGMIGPAQLAAMKKGAVLVNISRGALIDEQTLIMALQTESIGGAALDVFEKEPLPETSPLWDMPNVLVTPHVSGSSPYYMSRAVDIFCNNLARYLRNEPLKNLVDRERGY